MKNVNKVLDTTIKWVEIWFFLGKLQQKDFQIERTRIVRKTFREHVFRFNGWVGGNFICRLGLHNCSPEAARILRGTESEDSFNDHW